MNLNKHAFASLIMIILIVFSMTFIQPILAQPPPPPPEKPPEERPWWKEKHFNGTFIYWKKEQNTSEDSWSWINQAWEFGPYPSFKIYLQNGTEVTDANYIPLGERFKVVIDIKKMIFTGNTTLGRAGLNWNVDLKSENGTETGHANCRMIYVNEMTTKYWNESKTWHVESEVFNKTDVLAPMGQPPPPMEKGGLISFYQFDKNLSNVTENSDMWVIEIVGSFNATTTPVGPFWVNLEVTDSMDRWIDFGYVAWSGKTSPHRMVAVGKPGLVYGGFKDTWTFEKLDMENKSVYSVSRGSPWKMRINVTSSDLVNVTMGLELDWNVKTYVEVTGWYQTTVTEYGGWMYNETSRTYYWNSSVQVTRTAQVYGPHQEERWTNIQRNRFVNVTRMYWDPMTGQEKLETRMEFVPERMYLIYDYLTHEFMVKQGYSYWSYDPSLRRDQEYLFLYPLNTSDPTTRFYNLSISDCAWYQTGPDKYVIEFVGSFSNTTYSDRNTYWIQEPMVYSTYGRIWANWETISPSDFEIAVDRLVAITTIIDENGREVKVRMFQVNPGDFFIIQSKLQGASVKYTDIDGIGAVFRTGFGRWVSENESCWSDVEIRLVKDLTTGKLNSVTYNWTHRDAYVYGSYRGWELVNKTDWRQEYNSTTGTWEWVESTRPEWNETTLTGWHWEHLTLNQTEYALDPNSPNIWINMEKKWVPNEDPAFKMSESYATLNSAEISLVKGIVTVRLNITFSSSAPQRNYWWDVGFKNMTYGRDWSEGWGEHTVLEWMSEPVYYVNGTATGNEPWYVSSPSTPLYTMYNGEKYLLEETPYITIGSSDLLIRTRTHYDWGRREDVTEYLFRDPYDPTLGTEPRYYELVNGTKIYVREAYKALIHTLTLNATGAYKIVGTERVPLPIGTVFRTFMDHAAQDWFRRYWNETLNREIVPYYYELLNGTRVYRDPTEMQREGFQTQFYNWTTNRWQLSNPVYTESKVPLLLNYAGNGVALNQTTVVLLRDSNSWWQLLPDGTGYYLVMKNGTRIIHPNPWSVPDEQRIVTINGVKYQIGWPTQYYTGTYEGQTLMIRGGGWEGYVRPFYYTDLSVTGGTKYELPYPGAMAMSWWDLEGIESEGRKLKTMKSLTINGTKYMLYLSEDKRDYYIVIDGTRVSVTWPTKDVGYYYSLINGEEYWNVRQRGWILRFGTYSDKSGQFTSSGPEFVTTTGYDAAKQVWMEHNRWGYDRENATLYIEALNGTRYDIQSGIYLIIWKVKIGTEYHYTMDGWERWEMVYVNQTGQTLNMPYIITLNGTKVYFDWEKKPASWIQEIHVPVPGTNYTRLIPFTWQMRPIFDTVYIFNITIPALPGDPAHTGVYYEDGTEVPVNAPFKAFGTHWGPGIRQSYHWEGDLWVPDMNAWIPGTETPWNNSINMNYIVALNGTRLYSYDFGWRGDHWDESYKRWNFINDSPLAGNRTASVVEGGYCVYLNDTIRIDVTTQYPQGGWPDQYLIMKNNTYFSVHWIEDIHRYATVINDKKYEFRNVVTYYNLTDSGIQYYITDPINSDPHCIITPTYSQVPTIASDMSTWRLMNPTSEAVLHDGLGYYLINASDSSRLNLGLVSDWWTLPEKVRREMFSRIGELWDNYPRYNATIAGQEYFVLDPSPVVGRWDGEGTIEWNTYRYPNSIDVTLDGVTYTIQLFEPGTTNWKSDLRRRRIETIRFDDETTLEVQEQHQWKPAYQVQIGTDLMDVQLDEMNIYKRHIMWGEIYRWMLTDLNVHNVRSVWDIVVGTPEWGMWGIRAFGIIPETGAVDLDGDLATTSDQYFVRRIHEGSDMWNKTENRMWVELIWDPNASRIDDEIHIGAWMGKVHVEWTFQWNETYIWYYASNMSVVSSETLQRISATLINSENGLPNPGYWDIARMAENATWADLLARAEREHWDWIKDNKHEWDWLWFGTQQDFVTAWRTENGTQMAGVGLRYEFAGLSLYNGTTQTHFFMPKDVGNITLVTPGEAFGNMNATGEILVPLDETITFGVSYDNVTGTLFPFQETRSMWGWWDSVVYGADFDSPNFMNKPTEAAVDKMAFMIHFSANMTTELDNNEASMKIDQHVGNWNLDHDVIDGRKQDISTQLVSTKTQINQTSQVSNQTSQASNTTSEAEPSRELLVYLKGNDVLINRSLAINYYVAAFTGIAWDITDEKGESVDNTQVKESSTFSVAAKLANASFATVKLGSTYDLGKPVSGSDNIRTLNVTSKTTPIGSFQASYQSEAGKSSAGFEISAMMYFLTVGFSKWDGYAVYNDPEVSFLVSKGVTAPMGQPIWMQWQFWVLIGTVAALAVTLVFFRARVKRVLSRIRLPLRRSRTEPEKQPVATPNPPQKAPTNP